MMTTRELIAALQNLPPEALDSPVVYDDGIQYCGVDGVEFDDPSDDPWRSNQPCWVELS